MSSVTPNLKLYKADNPDAINVQSDINQNFDIIDRHSTFYTEITNILPPEDAAYFGQPVYWPLGGLQWGLSGDWCEVLANPSWLRFNNLQNNTNFSVPSATLTPIPFDTPSTDTNGLSRQPGVGFTYMQVNEPGVYLFAFTGTWSTSAVSSSRYFAIQLRDVANANTIRSWESESQCLAGVGQSKCIIATQLFTQADLGKKIRVVAYHEAGIAVNLENTLAAPLVSTYLLGVKLTGPSLAVLDV